MASLTRNDPRGYEYGRHGAGASSADLSALTARVAALEAATPTPSEVFTCPSGAAVGDIVYETTSTKVVDLADASNPTKMPARWFIASKPSPTTCTLQRSGSLGGLTGLTPGAVYYADPARPGKWITPAPAGVAGQVGQQVCEAISSSEIDISISLEPPVYY